MRGATLPVPPLAQTSSSGCMGWSIEADYLIRGHSTVQKSTPLWRLPRCTKGKAMTDLLLQPTGNPTRYEVIADGQIVGRIALLSSLRDHSRPWVWSIDLAFYKRHDRAHGFEATREAALQAFARCWDKP